jgi:hypothetical protein
LLILFFKSKNKIQYISKDFVELKLKKMQRETLGPLSRTKPYNGSLLRFISDSQKYTSNLSVFRRYILWRYSIGSGAVNYRLIFKKNNPNATYWVYLFFQYFKNTMNIQYKREVRKSDLTQPFRKYIDFFENPTLFGSLHIDMKAPIADNIIELYTEELQTILRDGPMVTEAGFTVYKVSSAYPGLPIPTPFEFRPTEVLQIPFNSTTIASDFNFAPFISTEGQSYLYSIRILGGTKGPLFIDSDLHAYSSFEHEILLPAGVIFDITNYSTVNLEYIDPSKIGIKTIQDPSLISMGNVFDLSEYAPIKLGGKIQTKPFTIFSVTLR